MNKLLLAAVSALALMSGSAWAERVNQLSDPKVRQAIAYAIDMDTIVASIFEGKALVADSMIPNGVYKAEGLNAYAYDPDKARSLLAEAGWDGSQVLDVVYYYGDQQTADLMVALQAYLGDVGIQMNYRKLEGDVGAQLNPVPEAGSDTSVVTWNMAYGAKAALAMQEYYNGYQTGQSSYAPGTPERDTLIAATNSTIDATAQQDAFKALEIYENTVLSDIPLYYQQLFVYESDRVNRNGAAYGNDQFVYDMDILNWTVAPDAAGKSVMYTNTAPASFFEHPWLNPGLNIWAKVGYDRLLTATPTLQPGAGQLAESYSVSDDGLTVSFTVRDGLTWHDGAPLTADDIAWSIDTAKVVPGINAVFASTFAKIAKVAVDGPTITLTFSELDPNALLTFSQFAPLPKHLLEGVKPEEFQQHPYWQNPVGSGPFKIAELQMNDFVRLVPFEAYHGGVAKIGEIVAFPSGENDANVIKNATAGRLDYGFTKSVGDVKALEAIPNMRVTAEDIPYTRSLRVNAYPRIADQ